LKPGFNPFKFGEGVRRLVTRPGPDGIERLYKKAPSSDPKNINRNFRISNYYGGTAVADAIGCNLRCVFCWAINDLRSYSKITEKASFYSPSEVAAALENLIKEYGLKYARITEGEPTLDMDHLCGILENLRKSKERFTFILETNGLLLGRYPKLARQIADYDKKVKKDTSFLHVRVSIKGATPEKFRLLTFADAKYHDLQFAAIKNCADVGLSVHPTTMLDFVEAKHETDYLRNKLIDIDPSLIKDLEWERLFLEGYVIERLKKYRVPFKMVFREEGAEIWKKE